MDYISELDFKRLWSGGLISLDTSVLLFLQECEAEYSKYIMDTLLFVEDRIWLPHQVAHIEMKKNFQYINPISGAIGRLQKFNEKLEQSIEKVSNVFESLSRELSEEGHNLLSDLLMNVNTHDMFYDLITTFKQRSDVSKQENEEFLQSGLVQVFQKSFCTYSNQILTTEDISIIEQEGASRYLNKVPPGYSDAKKSNNKFGDLIVWKELLKKSRDVNKPILFITRDKKEDWFNLHEKKIIGIREELLYESKGNRSEVLIIYLTDFIRMSSQLVSKNVDELLDKLESSDDLYSQIEEYINNNIYDEISDKLNEIGSFEIGSDYVLIDVIENLQFMVISKVISEDFVDIDCKVNFTTHVDHYFHVDSKEPDIEMSGSITIDVDSSITINILSGHHDGSTKTLDLTSTSIEFNNFEVTEVTDPFEEPEEYEPEEYEPEEYEPEEYEPEEYEPEEYEPEEYELEEYEPEDYEPEEYEPEKYEKY